ncbi:RNA degradosome polyphosphate kinase, partial [Schumannella sp. 10F1B-5-1]
TTGIRRYIPLEDLIANHLGELFPGMEVLEHHEFRVTRNEDVVIEEDETENLLQALEKELLRRRFGSPIRLEISD